jgi:hypothetical protein
MQKKTWPLMTVLAWVLAELCITASAYATESIYIVNTSGCIQWIQIKNSGGQLCVAKALPNNGDALLSSAKGTGISLIQAGPTKAIDDCCYSRKVNAQVSLSGSNWRISIEPSILRVINRDTYQEVFSASGAFSQCPSSTAPSVGIIGGGVEGVAPETPRD